MERVCLQSEAIDVDIDEILDMDTDDIRRSHLIVSATQLLTHWYLFIMAMLIYIFVVPHDMSI